jgi:hypothetical protein
MRKTPNGASIHTSVVESSGTPLGSRNKISSQQDKELRVFLLVVVTLFKELIGTPVFNNAATVSTRP